MDLNVIKLNADIKTERNDKHMYTERRKRKINGLRLLCFVLACLIIALMLTGVKMIFRTEKSDLRMEKNGSLAEESVLIEYPTEKSYINIEYPDNSGNVIPFSDDIVSKAGVLINVSDNIIVAGRDENKIIYPASMTKIMTLIVASENISSLDDTFTMTHEILEPLIDADASRAGFEENETITMEDMLYGAALPSGADATVGLALAISGSEEGFVKLMNDKVNEMGLKNTHFMNTSGLHDKNHYSTPVEMAIIMEYAMNDELCRKILSTYQYTTSKTKEHPQGILLESTMFGRMYGDEVKGAVIEGGKTGYTDEAENCLATFGTKGGKEYVSVTVLSYDYWLTIHDAFNIYANYIEPKSEIVIDAE